MFTLLYVIVVICAMLNTVPVLMYEHLLEIVSVVLTPIPLQNHVLFWSTETHSGSKFLTFKPNLCKE